MFELICGFKWKPVEAGLYEMVSAHNHPSYYQVSYWVITLFKFSTRRRIETVPNLSEEVLRQTASSPIFPIQQSYSPL